MLTKTTAAEMVESGSTALFTATLRHLDIVNVFVRILPRYRDAILP